MLDKLFGGDTFVATTHALDAATLRHTVYANNLANFNTPGYKRHEVSFEDKLSAAMATSDQPYGISGTSPVAEVEASVMTVNTTSTRTDGNNVDPETENAGVAANQLRFEALAQSVAGYFGSLKAVIAGR